MYNPYRAEREHEMAPWREKLNSIIFGAETKSGRCFDIVLIICIIISVLVVMLDTVDSLGQRFGVYFFMRNGFLLFFFQ